MSLKKIAAVFATALSLTATSAAQAQENSEQILVLLSSETQMQLADGSSYETGITSMNSGYRRTSYLKPVMNWFSPPPKATRRLLIKIRCRPCILAMTRPKWHAFKR
ncbi:hypothetical protein [Pseudoalteromonas sp. T1lg22]|uniref:hypothetical protein n=1 Tax=Pseudoalteromonas sp. T1lg22 TaxID=2077096 RepID=UPI001F461C08|nr:hypothetical protein [Pseudoalteromonas sp. T1lg22]